MTDFLDIAPCGLGEADRRFRCAYSIDYQCDHCPDDGVNKYF